MNEFRPDRPAWLWTILLAGTLLGGCMGGGKSPSAFTVANEQMAAGQWTEARRSLEREIKQHPGNLDARYDLALLLEQNGHGEDAAALYQDNLARGWHMPSAINLAQYRNTSGNPDAAMRLLREATGKSPHEAIPWYLLGDIALHQKQAAQAEEFYRQAIKADPKNGFAHMRLAAFFAGQKRLEDARQSAKLGIGFVPDCAPCWKQYGDILMASGQPQEAVAAYQRGLAIEPDKPGRQKLIDALRAAGQTERAENMQHALDAWH